ncbi:MAG: MFS transporter [Proteobacteria bacterium]|nr:MFS transporter [Pseudomonadota bacterium]
MRKSLRPIASLLLGIGFLLSGNGLLFTLLPLRGTAEHFGAFALGLIGSSYYVGFVAGCILAPFVVQSAGHIRAFSALVALAVAASLAYELAPHPQTWAALRLINGFCLAGIYLVVESWLNSGTNNETRGLVMSTYVVVNYGAFTIGQSLVTLYPITAAGDFMIAAMLGALGIIPVALTRSAQPAPIKVVRFRPVQLYRAAPVGLVASSMIGVVSGSFWSLGAISAAGSGLDVGHVAMFMSAATLAGAVSQWPVGRLSDRVDRRMVLLALLVSASVVGFLLWLTAASGPLLLVFGLLFGGLALPTYSLAAAHAYDRTPASETVPTAATILLVNAAGAVIGPLIASAIMGALDPRALFLFTAATHALLAVYVFYRTKVKTSAAADAKVGFGMAASTPMTTMRAAEAEDEKSDAPPSEPVAK